MLNALERRILALHERRGPWLAVAVARIFLAFAFVPAGLKKVIGQPFTDPSKTGEFHEFLHAFHATGGFYSFVGLVQLVAAALLLSQRFASLGAALFAPILSVILVFCWSTEVYPTATVVTLMWLTTLALVSWDLDRWRGLLRAPGAAREARAAQTLPLDLRLWAACGLTVTGLYLLVCLVTGEIYRPRGAEWGKPQFYVFPLMLLLVVGTWLLDRARWRKGPAGSVEETSPAGE
jgi:uncharacterized membrane protein YphA (DoxX/SURF4 family)